MCSDILRTPRTITSDGDPDHVLLSYFLVKMGTSTAKGWENEREQ
jgi:hypothetical protein